MSYSMDPEQEPQEADRTLAQFLKDNEAEVRSASAGQIPGKIYNTILALTVTRA